MRKPVYKEAVQAYYKEHPKDFYKVCAAALGCGIATVRRHSPPRGCISTLIVSYFRDNPNASATDCSAALKITKRILYLKLKKMNKTVVGLGGKLVRPGKTVCREKIKEGIKQEKEPLGFDSKPLWRGSKKKIRIMKLADKRKKALCVAL